MTVFSSESGGITAAACYRPEDTIISLKRGSALTLALYLLAACGDDPSGLGGTSDPLPASISIHGEASVGVGNTMQLTATVLDATGAVLTGATVAWTVDDSTLAAISPTGLVTGVSPGRATVAASVGTISATHSVTVEPLPPATIAISGGGRVQVDSTLQLAATVRDAGGEVLTDATVAWTVDDSTLVTITTGGLVTGMAPGQAEVTASVGTVSATHSVTVVAPYASISIGGGPGVLVGETLQLTAVVHDSTGALVADAAVNWGVDDSTLATISTSGVLKGISQGMVAVTASYGTLSQTDSLAVAPVLESLPFGLTGHFSTYVDDYPGRVQWGWGYSVYSTVFPVKPNMDEGTQLGWGTWMLPNAFEDENDVTSPRPDGVCQPGASLPSHFQSNEGGVGTWGNMKFPTTMPKFLIAATADCYSSGIGGPAYAAGGGIPLADDALYFAQLSNRLLVPADRLNFTEPSGPALFGSGWIALPIIPENYSPHGIPTGENSWTLFFNAANFAGPVGFFTPAFWTALDAEGGTSAGYGLDRRTMLASPWALEVGFTAAFINTVDGVEYRRIPRMTFAADADGTAVLAQEARYYERSALWDGVRAWMVGGDPIVQVDAGGTRVLPFNPEGDYAARLQDDWVDYLGVMSVVIGTAAGGGSTWGLHWSPDAEAGVIPEYYKKMGEFWNPIPASEVPARTWLAVQEFPSMSRGTVTPVPTDANSAWTSANWAAGPFYASLSDGSTVEYVWYRFVDQPAIARLNLTDSDKARIQAWVESLHAQGSLAIPPPTSGTLVEIDPGQIVSPPAGLSVGYVPIVIAQR